MNSIGSHSHSEIEAKKERARGLFAQMKLDIAKFAITENKGKYTCSGYISNTNVEIGHKIKLALVAMIHDEQLQRIKGNKHMSLCTILGAFICIYDSREMIREELNFEKAYETKIIDISLNYQKSNSGTEPMSLICIDVNPDYISDKKSPTKRLQEEFGKYIETTILDILLKSEGLCRKHQDSVRDILNLEQ